MYVNGTRIFNTPDSTTNGTLFTFTTNSITFQDVSRLPAELLTQFVDPPAHIELPEEGLQRDVYFGLTTTDVIKIVEKSTVEFDNSFVGDLPGLPINIKVLANEGVITQVRAARNYEITPDAKDDVIFIDIDDPNRFKASGVRQHKLWSYIR